jgi:hypothetical protein
MMSPSSRAQQQRHRRHRDQSSLDHRQPRDGHGDGIAAAQQHAIAGHQPEVLHQHPADRIHALAHLSVGD